MKKKKLFLHLGYPKTGSTTLNEIIMPNIKGLKSFIPNANYKFLRQMDDKKYLDDNYKIKVLIENFLYRKKDDNDIVEGLKILSNVNENKIFISSTGSMSAFFFKGLYTKRGNYLDNNFISKKINDVFGEFFDVSIILIIRRQWTWIPSAYAEWHRILDDKSFVEFSTKFKNKRQIFHKGIDYYNVLSSFDKYFQKKNIFVSTQEALTLNSFAFYTKLLKFIGGEIDEKFIRNTKKRNNRSGQKYKKIDRHNLLLFFRPLKMKYFPNTRFNFIKKYPWLLDIMTYIKLPYVDISKTIVLSKNDIYLIKKIYNNSNKKLSEKYGLNLEKFGYFDFYK